MPSTEKRLKEAEDRMKSLGASWKDKLLFWEEKNVETKKAVDEYNDAKNYKNTIEKRLDEKTKSLNSTQEKILEKTEEIKKITASISENEQKKEEVGLGILGVWPWLLIMLGLS